MIANRPLGFAQLLFGIFLGLSCSSFGLIKIYGSDDRLSVSLLKETSFWELSRSVGGIFSEKLNAVYCTGFFVAKNFVITNKHCQDECSKVSIKLDFVDNENAFYRKCIRDIAEDESLDVWVFEVEPSGQQVKSLELSNRRDLSKQPLILIGHSLGNEKDFDSSDDCRVLGPIDKPLNFPPSFPHGCDTLTGNSGSPLLSQKTGEVIGVHWAGSALLPPHSLLANYGVPAYLIREKLETILGKDFFD